MERKIRNDNSVTMAPRSAKLQSGDWSRDESTTADFSYNKTDNLASGAMYDSGSDYSQQFQFSDVDAVYDKAVRNVLAPTAESREIVSDSASWYQSQYGKPYAGTGLGDRDRENIAPGHTRGGIDQTAAYKYSDCDLTPNSVMAGCNEIPFGQGAAFEQPERISVDNSRADWGRES